MTNENEWKQVAPVSSRLREAMDAVGKSQSDLAEKTGLNKSTISRYLSGAVEPKLKAVGLMAKVLDVSEMWLFGYDVPKNRTDEQKRNDTIAAVVEKLRDDPDFYDVVSQLAELPAGDYASIKHLISALGGHK